MSDPTRIMNAGGPMVLGRYRLGSVLGRGGASTVHRAHDASTGQEVAVKEIPVDMDMARRAGAEVRAAGRLSHPGIVRLLDFGEDHHACYLVSELVEGAALGAHLREGTSVAAPAALLGVMADVLEGLAHAHERGVVHRDVKPANILVDRNGRGRLTDFGIARIAGEAGLTTTGGLVGTVSYMAPEQAGGGETGPPADVYSACLVVYEGLTGQNPNVGASAAETLRRAAAGRVPSLASARPGLPTPLCRAVDAGLNPDPRRRPDPLWLARTLRAQIPALAGAPRATGRWERHAPRAVAALTAASLAVAMLTRWTELRPGAVAGIAAAAAAGFATVPWIAAITAWAVGCVAIGRHAPATAALVGALGLVALLPLRTRGRLALLPAAAPFVAALGVVPLVALGAGLVRGWRWRLWAAVTSLAAIVGWQVVAGADPGVDGGRIAGAWPDLQDVKSPVTALSRLDDVLIERPSIAVAAGLVALAALAIPLVMRLRHGVPRAMGIAAWIGGLILAVETTGGSLENAIGAFVPGGILVAAWAAVPWRRLGRGTDRRRTVTLRGATVERLPAA